MVQVLVVRMDIGVVMYEAMTLQCGSYDTPVWEVSGSGPGCQSGYRSVDTPVREVSGSFPGCQSGYRSGDL